MDVCEVNCSKNNSDRCCQSSHSDFFFLFISSWWLLHISRTYAKKKRPYFSTPAQNALRLFPVKLSWLHHFTHRSCTFLSFAFRVADAVMSRCFTQMLLIHLEKPQSELLFQSVLILSNQSASHQSASMTQTFTSSQTLNIVIGCNRCTWWWFSDRWLF